MSSIVKLQINGFRSFCHVPNHQNNKEQERKKAQEQQEITFQKPLTLIWGHNGAGKTTIIECLKLATTGQYPPNSDRGKTFLTDSQLLRQTETQSLLQLDFLSMNQQQMSIRRNFRVTADAKGMSMTAVGTTLNYKHPETGEYKSLNQRCVEMDVKIPQLLGVTTPILTHVIFCHQEEQFWMFSDNQTLKKIFDELFDTTRFAKMQEWIKNTTKSQTQEQKKLVEQLINSKRDVEDSTRSRESTTKQLLELRDEAIKMQSTKQILDELNQRLQSKDLSQINRLLSDKQNTLSILQYKIKLNEEKIHNINITQSEKKLKKDRDDRLSNCQKLSLQQDRLIQELQRQQTEIENKKYELANLEESDNIEQTLKQELKQLKSQALSIVNLTKNDTDDTILRKIKQHEQDLESQLQHIKQQSQDKIQTLTFNQGSIVQSLSESQGQVQFLEISIKNLKEQIKSTEQQIKPNRETDQDNSIIQEYQTAKASLEQLNESLHEKQSQLSNLQRDQNALSQQISKQKPQLEYLQLQKELQSSHTQIKTLEREIQTVSKGLDVTNFQKQKESFTFKYTQIKRDLQMASSKINELNIKIKLQEEQIVVLQKLDVPNAYNKNYKQQLLEVCQRYEKAKESLIRFVFSSGDFVDQYIQGCQSQKKCILCYKPVDPSDIKAVRDRQVKNMATVKDRKDTMQKLVHDLKLEKQSLKKNNALFQQQEENTEKIEQIIMKVECYEMERQKIMIEHSELQRTCYTMEQELLIYDQVYPLAAQKNLIQKQIDSMRSRMQEMEKLNPPQQSNQTENVQREFDDTSKQISELYLDVSRMTKQKASQQEDLKRMDHKARQAEQSINQSQKYRIMLPVIKENLVTYQRDLNEMIQKLEQQRSTTRDLQEELQQLVHKINQLQLSRDQQTTFVMQDLPILQHIIPLIEKCLEKQMDMRKKKKSKQNQVIENHQTLLRDEILTLEAKLSKSEEVKTRVSNILQENDTQIKNIDEQLIAIGIKNENNVMQKEKSEIEILIQTEKEQLDKLQALVRDRDRTEIVLQGEQQNLQERFRRCNDQKRDSELRYKNVEKGYLELIFQEETHKAIVEDLVKYQRDAEQTLVQYHQEKMEEINKSIHDTWKAIYEGEDIQRIFIKADEDPATSKKGSKSYYYRIVMESKSGVEMDMKGRCSMGQKVLASIVIRLALTESFGNHCGVLALDEPTTNLDINHIEKLAQALSALVELMSKYKQNLQLIIITHDKTFVKMMSKYTTTYVGITKMPNGFSKIEEFPLE